MALGYVSPTAVAVLALGVAGTGLAQAATYTLSSPHQQIIGHDHSVTTVYADSLYSLARQYDVPSPQMINANPGVHAWVPGAGKTVLVPRQHILPPGPHVGIIVNLPEQRLYYFPPHRRGARQQVVTYPVSDGQAGWRTPVGLTYVVDKERNPVWIVPPGVAAEHRKDGDPLPAVIRPGPQDPLGQFAMRLGFPTGEYLIHGTNQPIAVGMPVTHGCVRLYPKDIEALFRMVRVGTRVRVINDPVKIAWVGGRLYLEAYPVMTFKGKPVQSRMEQFSRLLRTAVGKATVAVNWDRVRQVIKQADGVLAVVGVQANLSAMNAAGSGALPVDGSRTH